MRRTKLESMRDFPIPPPPRKLPCSDYDLKSAASQIIEEGEIVRNRLLTYPAHPAGYPSGSEWCPDGYKIIKATNCDNTSHNKQYAYME